MKIPKRINVLGYWYKVKVDDKYCTLNEVYGMCNLREKTIYICSPNYKTSDANIITQLERENVFFHEVEHAIRCGLGLPNDTDEEKEVDAVSMAWASIIRQLLKENK